MGVDCRITLPAAARLRDVADVLGALAGLPMKKNTFDSGGFSARCPKVRVSGWDSPGLEECAKIELNAPLHPDGYVMYHFEGSRKGERLLMPRSTDFWIAVGKGLVDFFGGSLDYIDCDNTDVDYKQPARKDIHAEDGDEWDAFQERKLAVKAVTKADLKACQKVAAYK